MATTSARWGESPPPPLGAVRHRRRWGRQGTGKRAPSGPDAGADGRQVPPFHRSLPSPPPHGPSSPLGAEKVRASGMGDPHRGGGHRGPPADRWGRSKGARAPQAWGRGRSPWRRGAVAHTVSRATGRRQRRRGGRRRGKGARGEGGIRGLWVWMWEGGREGRRGVRRRGTGGRRARGRRRPPPPPPRRRRKRRLPPGPCHRWARGGGGCRGARTGGGGGKR